MSLTDDYQVEIIVLDSLPADVADVFYIGKPKRRCRSAATFKKGVSPGAGLVTKIEISRAVFEAFKPMWTRLGVAATPVNKH